MTPTTPAARSLMPLFEALAQAAGLPTGSKVRVSVSLRNKMPYMRAGVIYMPGELVPWLKLLGRSVVIFAHTFLHELKHAADYHDGTAADLSREEMEARAVAAERLLSDETIRAIVQEHLSAELRAHPS